MLAAPGAYRLNDTLALTDDVEIIGQGARATQIDGESEVRVLDVGAGVTVQVLSVAIQNGNANGGDGGNIINRGDLTLFFSRVDHGTASSGGGIANLPGASLGLLASVVDHNTSTFGGGGIDSGGVGLGLAPRGRQLDDRVQQRLHGRRHHRSRAPATRAILDTTIARNTAGGGFGIASGAIDVGALRLAALRATSRDNCPTTAKPIDEGYNLDDSNSCALDVQGEQQGRYRPGIERGSCRTRAATRTCSRSMPSAPRSTWSPSALASTSAASSAARQPCDAGAYEQSATGPATPTISSGPPDSTTATSASFSFAIADDPAATFVCQLTGPGHTGGYVPCTSPQQYAGLAPGDYVFAVALADPTGQQPSGSPSFRTFRVTSPAAQTATPTPTPTPTPRRRRRRSRRRMRPARPAAPC